jgi:hypothetical protein
MLDNTEEDNDMSWESYKEVDYCKEKGGIKYNFGIQVPRGIKNAIDLDKKNENYLWQEAINTELEQLTDYQTFLVLDSGGGYYNRISENSLPYGL